MCVHLSKMSISVMVVYAVLDVVRSMSDFYKRAGVPVLKLL